MRRICVAFVACFCASGTHGAHQDLFDQATGRQLDTVAKEPEVDIAARSERIDQGQKVSGHFGNIRRLPNGDIVAAHIEAKSKAHGGYDPTSRLLVRISSDGGYTWTPGVDPFVGIRSEILKGKERMMRLAHLALSVLRDGTILLGPITLKDGQRHVPRSRDRGQTWDFETTIPAWVRDYVEMDNRQIVAQAALSTDQGVKSRAVLISGPDMKQWDLVTLGPQAGYQTDEACTIATGKPGELYMLMRDQDCGHYYTNAWSRDCGRTWAGYAPSGLWYSLRPSKPHVSAAGDGMLLAAHAERSNGRIVVTPSFDRGRTWDLTRRIFLVDAPGAGNALGSSHGYCSMARSSEDTWFVAWYDPRSYRGSTAEVSYITRPYQGACLAARSAADHALLARWPFEGNQRNVVEGWPNCDYGRATMIGRRPGKIGQAAFFNGRTSSVQVPDTPTMRVGNFFSVECFFRAERLEGDQALLSKRPYYYLGIAGHTVTFQIGPASEPKSSRKTFRIDSPEPVRLGQWHHVAAVVGPTGRNYKMMRLYIDGKEAVRDNLTWAGMGRDMSFAEAAFYLDQRPESGPMFMNYGEYDGYQTAPKCHLTLGVDNQTGKSRLKGEIDEASLYRRDLLPAEVASLSARGYVSQGTITSDPIALDGPHWGTFQVKTATPPGTAIAFRVLNADSSKTLLVNLKEGQSLRNVRERVIRLHATLSTTKPSVTPVLKSWAITGSGDD